MSSDIWIFSDHHFSHSNILNFRGRDGKLIRPMFENVNHMDEYMIDMWNESIKPGDSVWHLGDITMNSKKFTDSILNKLHGKIRMVIGNHDDALFLAKLGRIQKLVESRRFDEFGFVCTHTPRHRSGLWNFRRGCYTVNVHGHTHINSVQDDLYINVCVEQTGYKPIHIEDLTKQVRVLQTKWLEKHGGEYIG